MSKHMQTSNLLDTKAVKSATFGDILIIDFNKSIDFAKISDTSGFKDIGVVETDKIYKKVEEIFKQPNRIDSVSIFGTTETNLKSALDEMWLKNKKYYFVLTAEFDEVKSKAVIEWAVAKGKMPVYLTEKDIDYTKAEKFFKDLNSKAIPFATGNDDDYLDAKMVGLMATTTPGRDKWEWKEPSGAKVSGFSLTDQDKFETLGINTIQEEREGVLCLFPGKCSNGEFIDIVWGNDNMQYDIETAFIAAEKKPHKIYHPGVDDRGVVQIEGIVQSIIDDYAGTDREFIALDANKKPKAKIDVKRNYTEQEIKARKFQVSWAAIPTGSASFGKVEGLLTFDKTKIEAV